MRTTRWWVAAATTSLMAAALSPLATPATAQDPSGPGAPPIPPDPLPSTLGLVLEEYAQLPASTPNGPWTDVRIGTRHNRINHIGELPDGSDRLYVPDLNGQLYFLEDRQPSVYLDVKAEFPEFLAWRGLGSGFGFVTFHPEFEDNGKFYTTHTEVPPEVDDSTYPGQPYRTGGVQSVVTEWTADDPAADTFAGTRRELFRYRFAVADPRHPADRLQPDRRARRRGLRPALPRRRRRWVRRRVRHPPAAVRPVRQDPAHRPGRHRRAQRSVRRPRHQPVGRRDGSARRDLGDRHARPAPVQLGRGGQARDVPRPHRPARHRGRLRGRPGRRLRLAGRRVAPGLPERHAVPPRPDDRGAGRTGLRLPRGVVRARDTGQLGLQLRLGPRHLRRPRAPGRPARPQGQVRLRRPRQGRGLLHHRRAHARRLRPRGDGAGAPALRHRRHADADVRLRRRRPRRPALRHRRRPAASTCWPRPTG